MNKRTIIFFILISLLLEKLVCQQLPPPPPHSGNYRAYHGNRIPDRPDIFALIGIKIRSSIKEENVVIIELFFNDGLNPQSITTDCITITNKNQEEILIPEDSIFFSKNIRSVRFVIPTEDNAFSLEIKDIKSFTNEQMLPIQIDNLELDTEYHYSRRDKIWKRF